MLRKKKKQCQPLRLQAQILRQTACLPACPLRVLHTTTIATRNGCMLSLFQDAFGAHRLFEDSPAKKAPPGVGEPAGAAAAEAEPLNAPELEAAIEAAVEAAACAAADAVRLAASGALRTRVAVAEGTQRREEARVRRLRVEAGMLREGIAIPRSPAGSPRSEVGHFGATAVMAAAKPTPDIRRHLAEVAGSATAVAEAPAPFVAPAPFAPFALPTHVQAGSVAASDAVDEETAQLVVEQQRQIELQASCFSPHPPPPRATTSTTVRTPTPPHHVRHRPPRHSPVDRRRRCGSSTRRCSS